MLNVPGKQAQRYSNYPFFAGGVVPPWAAPAHASANNGAAAGGSAVRALLSGRRPPLLSSARQGQIRQARKDTGKDVPESGVHFGRCLSPVSLFLKTWLHPKASEWRPRELVDITLDPLAWFLDEKRRWTVPRLANKIEAESKWVPWFVKANRGRFPYLFPSLFPTSDLEYYVHPSGVNLSKAWESRARRTAAKAAAQRRTKPPPPPPSPAGRAADALAVMARRRQTRWHGDQAARRRQTNRHPGKVGAGRRLKQANVGEMARPMTVKARMAAKRQVKRQAQKAAGITVQGWY